MQVAAARCKDDMLELQLQEVGVLDVAVPGTMYPTVLVFFCLWALLFSKCPGVIVSWCPGVLVSWTRAHWVLPEHVTQLPLKTFFKKS